MRQRHWAEALCQALASADKNEIMLREYVGCAEDNWVPAARYEEAKALGQEAKRVTLEVCAKNEETKEDYAVIDAHWPLDDMEEKEFEEYKESVCIPNPLCKYLSTVEFIPTQALSQGL